MIELRKTEAIYFYANLLIACFLIAIFTALIYQQSVSTDKSNGWVLHTYEVLRRTDNFLLGISAAQGGMQSFAIKEDSKYLDQFYGGMTTAAAELGAIRAITADNPKRQFDLSELQRELDSTKKSCTIKILPAQHQKKSDIASLKNIEPCTNKLSGMLKTALNARSAEITLLNGRMYDLKNEQSQFLLTLFLGSLAALAALVAANIFIFRLLARGRKISEKLSHSEALYAKIMNNLSDGIYDHDIPSASVYFSDRYRTILGYNLSDLPGTLQSFNSLLHPADATSMWETFHAYATQKSQHFKCEYRLRHKDGQWHWMMARGIGFWSPEGRMERFICEHTDITEQKEREEELRHLNNELENFTYIASHDLKVPLVNLKGFSTELSRNLNELCQILNGTHGSLNNPRLVSLAEQEIPESLRFIQIAADRMDQITNSILELSRLGRRKNTPQEINLNELTQQCLDMLAYEINKKKVKIIVNPLPNILSDLWSLTLIFSNILDNAIKYLDPNRSGQITISAQQLSHEIIITISDNGRGIAESEHAHVFDIFRRASNSSGERGTGMGMAYVKTVVRNLRGRIWFESTLNKGTSFHIALKVSL